jgi:hypothetical protein
MQEPQHHEPETVLRLGAHHWRCEPRIHDLEEIGDRLGRGENVAQRVVEPVTEVREVTLGLTTQRLADLYDLAHVRRQFAADARLAQQLLHHSYLVQQVLVGFFKICPH